MTIKKSPFKWEFKKRVTKNPSYEQSPSIISNEWQLWKQLKKSSRSKKYQWPRDFNYEYIQYQIFH